MSEISKGRAIKNNVYAVKLLRKLCPRMVFHKGMIRFVWYFEWLFYSGFFMRFVINAMEEGKDFKSILLFLAITVAVFASTAFYNAYLDGTVLPCCAPEINNSLYKILFRKARNVELSCFEDSDFYDKYTLAMENADVRLIETVEEVFGVAFGLVASVLAFIFMYQVDPYSVLFIIFPFIGNFVFNRMLSKVAYDRNKDMAPYNRKIAYINRVMYLTDYAKEMRLTNVFGLMGKQYREAIAGVSDVTKKYTKRGMALHWFYVNFTFTFIFEGLLIYGAYRAIASKTMSLAELAVLSSLMVSTTWIMIGFTESLAKCFKNGLFIEYLRTFLNYEEKIPEDAKGEDPGEEIHSLEFRNVCFSYKDTEVLHNLNFEFRGGKTYALVGHNGAGKTTIIKLLLRFYDPTSGEILLNGKDIRLYNLQKYRKLFATAFQDNRVLSMSVIDNVIMEEELEVESGAVQEAGTKSGTEQEAKSRSAAEREKLVVDALKLSGVYEKVMSLPQGLNTTLTREFDEQGAMLSGGEIQKIVVARAFVRKSPIKVFDEPSSALDPIAEYSLFENILKSCRNNTLIFISHRLSSVKNADWIYLLEEGTVKEEGSHAMMMEQRGSYADMYTKQARNYLADADKSFV